MGNRASGRRYWNDDRYDKDGNKQERYVVTRGQRDETEDTLWGWNVGAALVVLIPFFVLFISQMIQVDRWGSRWRLWNSGEPGNAAVWGTFLWGLLLLVGIVWYGNRVAITERASHNMRTLLGALFILLNLSGIMCLLVYVFSVRSGNLYRGPNWAGQFSFFVFLFFLCMAIFAAVFLCVVQRRLHLRTRDGAFNYRREEDVMPKQ